MATAESKLHEWRIGQLEEQHKVDVEWRDMVIAKLNSIETKVEVNRIRIGLYALGMGGIASVPAVIFTLLR